LGGGDEEMGKVSKVEIINRWFTDESIDMFLTYDKNCGMHRLVIGFKAELLEVWSSYDVLLGVGDILKEVFNSADNKT
jgi:hypothetical protein